MKILKRIVAALSSRPKPVVKVSNWSIADDLRNDLRNGLA